MYFSPVDINENSLRSVCSGRSCPGTSSGCVTRVRGGAGCSAACTRQLAAVSALSLGCLLDGIVLAYSSPALPSLDKVSSTPVLFLIELETKVKQRFAKVSIVSYSCPSLMIIASASQFHVYLPWGQRPFSIVS